MTNDDAWRLEEYKALRAEILANEDYQKTLVVWGTSVVAVALAVAFDDKSAACRYIVLFFVQILASCFWYTWEGLATTTELIGTYICLYHEKTSTLNWELFQRRWAEGKAPKALAPPPPPTPPLKSFLFIVGGSAIALPFAVAAILSSLLLWCDAVGPLRIWPDSPSLLKLPIRVLSTVAIAASILAAVRAIRKKLPSNQEDNAKSRLEACLAFREASQKESPEDRWYFASQQIPESTNRRDE